MGDHGEERGREMVQLRNEREILFKQHFHV